MAIFAVAQRCLCLIQRAGIETLGRTTWRAKIVREEGVSAPLGTEWRPEWVQSADGDLDRYFAQDGRIDPSLRIDGTNQYRSSLVEAHR